MLRPGRILRKPMLVMVAIVVLPSIVAVMFSQGLFTVDSGEVKADAMVVLGGGGEMMDRPRRAVQLFQQGVAPKILVSGRGDCEFNVNYLEENGVPASAISSEELSASTLENAKFSAPLLRRMGAQRVIIVTSWYHSRRALACFRHFAPDITFYSRPSYEAYAPRDWVHHGFIGYLIAEHIKTLGYSVCYGIGPF
jgi:uncharacterized SAM-binding protein YcdF (DUF218 family)